MRLQRITELVYHRPWLIVPSGHATVRALIESKLAAMVMQSDDGPWQVPTADGGFVTVHTQAAGLSMADFIIERPQASVDEKGVGHVHVRGVIGAGMSRIEKTCGNTDTGDLMDELAMVREKGAEKIMLHVDSPGGTVGGVAEVADAIASSDVPVFAYVGPGQMAASAAYWLISGADRIYSSSTAELGSIGVYLPWIDSTAAAEARGYKVELIKNREGDLKGAGYPGTPLTDEQRADWQESVQQIFDNFAGHVRAYRGEVADDTMRGQTFWGKDAKKRNLSDGVVDYSAAMRTLKRYKRPS